MTKQSLFLAASLAALAFAQPAPASPAGIKIGVLSCNVASGWGYIVGSSKTVTCVYHPHSGEDDRYSGSISDLGVDIGYTSSATLVWDVIAPTSDMHAGALAGDYAGASASATVAAGVGANVLLGGFDKSIALQPVSFESSSGLDVAGGIGELSLHAAPPEQMGEAAPAPPAPLAPPAPQPMHNVIYQITFRFDKAQLTPEGRAVVQRAAERAEQLHAPRILVSGNADSVGTDRYNQTLSLKRAETVKAELMHDGIDERRIYIAGRGDRDPLIPTPKGVREKQNRRAVIDIRSDENPREAER